MGKVETSRYSTHQFMEAWSKYGKEKDYDKFLDLMCLASGSGTTTNSKGEEIPNYPREQVEARLAIYKEQMAKAGIAKSKIPKHPKPKTASCVAWFKKQEKEANAE